MNPPVQSRNTKAVKTKEIFRLATPEKIPSWGVSEKILYSIFWYQKGISLISSPKGHDYQRRMLQRHFEELVVAWSCSKCDLNWWMISSFIKTTLQHTRLELSQNSWWNRELRHFDILSIHLTLLRAISGCLTSWNSLSRRKIISSEIKSKFSSLPVSKTHT